MVLVLLTSMFAVQINAMIAITNKGKLDRVTYSLVSILAERKQFFSDEGDMCADSKNCQRVMSDLLKIAISSLGRMSGEFDEKKLSMQVEELRRVGSSRIYNKRIIGSVSGCHITSIKKTNIQPKTTRTRYLPLYQISLCYETAFNVLGIRNDSMTNIVSSAFALARI